MPFCAEKNKRIPDKKTVDPTALRRMDARLNVNQLMSLLKKILFHYINVLFNVIYMSSVFLA